jgi:hypothetical protein
VLGLKLSVTTKQWGRIKPAFTTQDNDGNDVVPDRFESLEAQLLALQEAR